MTTPRTPADRLARLREDVERIATDTLGLFLEYRDKHGYEEHMARVAAVAEVIEGESERVALASPAPTLDRERVLDVEWLTWALEKAAEQHDLYDHPASAAATIADLYRTGEQP